MKLEVGMYVRTKRRTLQPPQIAKITNISKDVVLNQYFIELDKNLIPSYKYHIYEEDILKASHNIIDLIEVGDYVNGVRIDELSHNRFTNAKAVATNNSLRYDTGKQYWFENEDIKSIVTKEQFAAMQYKVV